jgi:L-fuculose-phosphate aldolase
MTPDPRLLLVEICHLLAAQRFTSATGGNISVKLADGTFWVTPSCLHKARVRVEDLMRIAADGTVLEGTRRPSSETPMHLAMYRALPQMGAVIHAHSPIATGFAQAGKRIETNCSSEAYEILGPYVPLLPYARPSTAALADTVADAMCPRHHAYLLANHGVLTWGNDLWEAYDMLDTLETFAQSLLAAYTLGGPTTLPADELRWFDEKHGAG